MHPWWFAFNQIPGLQEVAFEGRYSVLQDWVFDYLGVNRKGITAHDRAVYAAGAQGLPNVDPVYTWVRLAQRVPIRIAIDDVPAGVPLVSGTTATVTVRGEPDVEPWFRRAVIFLATSVSDLIGGVSARPGCIPSGLMRQEMRAAVQGLRTMGV